MGLQKWKILFFLFQLEKYSTTILSAMMAGMDDKDDLEDEITLESMSGLAKILAKLDENNVRQILINICLRIRPCFEKVCANNFLQHPRKQTTQYCISLSSSSVIVSLKSSIF